MLLAATLAALALSEPAPTSASTPASAPTPVAVPRLELPQVPPGGPPPRRSPRQALRRYLTREVARSARFLDHGVIGVAVGAGVPHLYRVELQVGLLDHLTLGAAAHWLPGQSAPGWTPRASLAFYRGRLLAVGAMYTQVLYPPTRDDGDPTTAEWQRRAHYLLASVSLSQAWFTGGFDLGWGRGREAIPLSMDDLEAGPPYAVRDRVAGGLHLRFGTRRIGVTAQAWFPFTTAEIALDFRFGAFEARPRGGWWRL